MNMVLSKWRSALEIVNGQNQNEVANSEGIYPIYGSGGAIGRATDFLCPAGTTIVGRKGTINRPIYVNEPFWNVDTAFGLVPGNELNSKYLYYFCCSFNFTKLDNSTTIPSLSKSVLLEIEMPLPPLPKQERIVARIEELFSDLDKGVETLQTIKAQLKVYRQAVLKEAFEGCEQFQQIKSCTTLVTSGSRGWAQYYSPQGAAFIRIGNLTQDKILIDFSDTQFVQLPDRAEGTRSLLKPNDILVSITANLGSIALVPETIQEAYINQHIALIRLKHPSLARCYAWYLRSDLGQKDLLRNKRGAGKLGLGLDDIRETRVPIIDDSEAEKIVETIESRLSVCDKIEQPVDESLAKAESLRQSILKKAFEGRL